MMRSISSHVFQPTSPSQTSFVPGRIVKRNGLRSPCAMIRRAFRSELPISGLPGAAAPVATSDRCGESRRRAWSGHRRWSADPDSESHRPRCGRVGVCHPAPEVRRQPLPVVDLIEARAVAAGDVQHPVRAEGERADRVARKLLAPVVDEHGLGARRSIEPGESAAHATSRGGGAVGARVGVHAGRPVLGRRARDVRVVGVEDVE